MDALSSIQSRIADIQTRIATLDRTVPTARSVMAATAVSSTSSAATFGATLASEQRAASVTSVDAVGAGRSEVDAKGVPIAFRAYGNGKVPSSALSTISGTSDQMWSPAARSFEAMRAAAAADGATLGITDSYRSYDEQVDVAARKGIYGRGGLAAVPGTSNHGWGTALDLRLDSTALAWMKSHGGEYGFVDDTPGESWHWHYVPTR